MSLKLNNMKAGAGKAERIPEGTYMGRMATVVDLGVQAQTDYLTGEEKPAKAEVLITFELPTERIDVQTEDGETVSKPRWISKQYAASNSEMSNLYKLVQALNSKVGDVSELIGTACMISVGSTSGGNAKITNVIKAPNGMDIAEVESGGSFFDFDAPDEENFLKNPEWVRTKIMDAENYNGFADGWGA